MKIIKKIALIIGIAPLLSLGVMGTIVTASPFDNSKNNACAGLQFSDNGDCTAAAGKAGQVNNVLKLVVNILSFVVGVAAVIMIIISGLRFVTSNGDSSTVSSAKNGIIYSIVGLVIAALAQVFVRFILQRL